MNKTFCNPLNLEYKYQHYTEFAHRESADPTIVYFKGKYYIFASVNMGFYYSDDLINWNWHFSDKFDPERYAPDAHVINDKLVFCASISESGKGRFLITDDPFSGEIKIVDTTFPFWDPTLFQDDDKRVYLYWGCSNDKPLYGVELNGETFLPIGEKKELVFGDDTSHGFERKNYPGKDTDFSADNMSPYIEGPFVNKFGGKYYLQYSAPATEIDTYSNGVYTSENPLGPFKFQKHNPFASKPGGFITGAGHGSTGFDKYGNLWHFVTMRLCVNAMFERRLGMLPAGVDEDGNLFCNTNFSDYPLEITGEKQDLNFISPKWMLLSYKKPVKSSSFEKGFEPQLAVNECIRTSWCAKSGENEWFEIDLGDVYDVRAIQINFADVGVDVIKDRNNAGGRYIDPGHGIATAWILDGSIDGKCWFTVCDKSDSTTDRANDYVELYDGKKLRYLKITSKKTPYNSKFALSGLRVFGNSNCNPPAKTQNVICERVDDLTAKITWNKARGAIGYNIRYSVSKDKLYSSCMVYEKTEAFLTMLNKGSSYYVCVDSFNEGGVTKGEIFGIK